MKSFAFLLLIMLTANSWAEESQVLDRLSLPAAGSQMYIQLDSIEGFAVGSVFQIADDRYGELVMQAKVVSLDGKLALIEIVDPGKVPVAGVL